jgi:hypothetical protein
VLGSGALTESVWNLGVSDPQDAVDDGPTSIVRLRDPSGHLRQVVNAPPNGHAHTLREAAETFTWRA